MQNEQIYWKFLCFRISKIPLEESPYISPWRQWKKYKRIPFKFILHIFITILITYQVILITKYQIPYLKQTQVFLSGAFLPDSESYLPAMDGFIHKEIFTNQDFIDTLKSVTQTYYGFSNDSIGLFDYNINEDNQIEAPIFTIEEFTKTSFDEIKIDPQKINYETDFVSYPLTLKQPCGPFTNLSNDEVQNLFAKFRTAQISFSLLNLFVSEIVQCVQWNVLMSFSFVRRGGRLLSTIDFSVTSCGNQGIGLSDLLHTGEFFSAFFLIIFSFFSMITSIRLLSQQYTLYKNLSQKKEETKQVQRLFKSTTQFKIAFFDFWHVTALIGSVITIFAEAFYIYNQAQGLNQTQNFFALIFALASLFSWANLSGYFQWHKKFYLLILTLRKAIPNLLRFLAGTFPLFIGYAYMGTLYFGNYCEYFATIDQACVTLFAVLNGDVVRDTFNYLYRKNHGLAIFARIYMYTFTCLFIYAWLKLFITLVECAYSAVKEAQKPAHLVQRKTIKKLASSANFGISFPQSESMVTPLTTPGLSEKSKDQEETQTSLDTFSFDENVFVDTDGELSNDDDQKSQ
ncbi:hypothetical protein M0811_12227 [Anaeramoeba ignava]|uniref:Polycystin cation channel PKD1/PKD2 domain-containing protein n=1 Tax=Anaeramoeba ignava TaxID=1746090 RepID=A0A9Q0L9X7_ANAIG|nr:hypothetical protein M0811_12227 [Anaeramoeba ignava]